MGLQVAYYAGLLMFGSYTLLFKEDFSKETSENMFGVVIVLTLLFAVSIIL